MRIGTRLDISERLPVTLRVYGAVIPKDGNRAIPMLPHPAAGMTTTNTPQRPRSFAQHREGQQSPSSAEVIMQTLLDPRQALWERRRDTIAKVATMREYRAAICGCDHCGDAGKAAELDGLIARATKAIDELSDRICTRSI